MHSAIARLSLALTLFLPALRAQPVIPGLQINGLNLWGTTSFGHTLTALYTDNSGDCVAVGFRHSGNTYVITSGPVVVQDAKGNPIDCEAVDGLSSDDFAALLAGSSTGQSPHIRPRASSTSSPSQLWIGSFTPPSTVPSAGGAVYVVDPSTFDIVAAVPLSGIPSALTSNPAGTYMYAVTSAMPGPPVVAAIDTSSYSIAQTINLPQGANPGIPAISPDGRYVYLPNNGTGGGVLLIDTQNPSSITIIPTTVTYPSLSEPAGVAQVAISPDGELLFAWGSYNIFVIDTTTRQQIGQILLPDEQGNTSLQNEQHTGANYFVIDPTGSRIYAYANYGSGPSDTFTGYLYVYDTATLSLVGSMELMQGVNLDNIAITPDGSMVFVSSFVYANGQNAIFTLDTRSLAVTQGNLTPPPLEEGFWQTLLAVLQ